jgi:ubiquinone/menaquinone biosynthesis C-methylase UbiE
LSKQTGDEPADAFSIDSVLATWSRYQDSPEEAFDTFLVPVLLRPFAEDLLEAVQPGPGERALDIACGSGAVACAALHRVGGPGFVVGVDFDPRMLAFARTKPGSITWTEAPADSLPQPDGSFDIVLCQQGLQFFSDRRMALREMYRVLVGGGRLGLSVWRSIEFNPVHRALRAPVGRHVGAEAGEAFFRVPTSLGEASELDTLVREAGFHEVRVVPQKRVICFDSSLAFLAQWGGPERPCGPGDATQPGAAIHGGGRHGTRAGAVPDRWEA